MTMLRIVALLVSVISLTVAVIAAVRARRHADIVRRMVPTPHGLKMAPTDRELREAKRYYLRGDDGTEARQE